MSGGYEPPRWHGGRFLLASAIFVGVSLLAVLRSTHEVAQATKGLPGPCGVAWWPADAPCPSILLLVKLAGREASARPIAQAIQVLPATKAAAVESVKRDYLLILSYVACLGFLGATVAGTKELYDVTWARRALLAVVFLQGVAGVFDGVENVGLLTILESECFPSDVATRTFWFSTGKWCLIALGLAAPVLAYMARRAIRRRVDASPTVGVGATGV